MGEVELKRVEDFAYREVVPDASPEGAPVLCIHGWPQSSYMWRHLLPALGSARRRAVAPDLPGFGDSPPEQPGTWERKVESLDSFHSGVGLEAVVLAVHDTGGAIGLRWACDHADKVAGLVISNTGFFPDYEWHELGRALRTEGQGEALLDSLSRDGLKALLDAASAGGIDEEAIDEYWKVFASKANRRATLELYRSMNVEELEPYEGKLAELGVPTFVIWGEQDDFLPKDYANRFAEIPGAELVTLPDTGHFLFEDEPERCSREVVEFLERVGV